MSLTLDESSAAPARDSARDGVEGEEQEEVEFGDYAMPNTLNDAVAADAGEADGSADRMLVYLQEARGEEDTEERAGLPASRSAFRKLKAMDDAQEAGGRSPTNRAPSSAGSYSTPDDTPSLHVRMRWGATECLADSCCRVPSLPPRLSGVY